MMNRLPNHAPYADDLSECTTAPVTPLASAGVKNPGRNYPIFERYEILGELGRGGMGVVFKAMDRDLKRPVAIKMILNGALAADDALARFRSEMEAVGRLNHPNLVRIYETGNLDERPYAVMEFIEGGTLADHIAYRTFSPEEAARIVADLADGVESAHQRGVLHRDLKPANVLLHGTQPKIVDFGLAKLTGATDCTQTGDVIGSPNYMAPERVTGPKTAIGVGVDTYALGAILFELLTKHMPFEGDSPADVLRRVVDHEAPNVRTMRPDVSRDLATICQKCMQKQPAQRYATARELADDLRRFLRHEPIKARPISAGERLWRWGRRNPAIACALGFILLLLTGVAVVSTVAAQWHQESANDLRQALADITAESERGEWLLYQTNMASVASSLQLNNQTTAAAALARAPEKHRGWEWRYFNAQLDQSEFVLDTRKKHLGEACYSPDGRHFLLQGADTLVVFDAKNYAVRERLTTQGTVVRSRFTPDGQEIVWSEVGGRVWFYNLTTKTRRELRLPVPTVANTEAWTIQYAADGRTMSLARNQSDKGVVLLLPQGDPAKAHVLDHEFPIGRAQFLPDSKQLIVVTKYKIMVWNVQDGTLAKRMNCDHMEFYTSAINAAGTRLACSGQYPRLQIELWDLVDGIRVAVMNTHSNSISSLAFSADGRWLASGSLDETACVWDATTGRLHKELRGHTQRVCGIMFAPDSRSVYSLSYDATIRMWDVTTGHPQAVLRGHDSSVVQCALNGSGTKLLSFSTDDTMRGWDIPTINRQHVLGKHDKFVYGVAAHPTKPHAASAAWDGTIREWDWQTGQLLRVLPHEKRIVTAVTYDATGERLFAITREGDEIRNHFHEWRTGDTKPRTRDARGSYWEMETNVAPSPDQQWLAVGGEVGYVNRWPAHGMGAPKRYTVGPVNNIVVNTSTVAWHPNSREFVTGSTMGHLIRWSLDQPDRPDVWDAHASIIHHVLYSPDGRWILSAGDRQVNVWDGSSKTLKATLPHGGKVFQMAYHPNGDRLVTACSDNSIRIWDMEKFAEVAELRGHSKYVHAVAFTPDGERLISGSGDGTVRVWDAQPIKRFPTYRVEP